MMSISNNMLEAKWQSVRSTVYCPYHITGIFATEIYVTTALLLPTPSAMTTLGLMRAHVGNGVTDVRQTKWKTMNKTQSSNKKRFAKMRKKVKSGIERKQRERKRDGERAGYLIYVGSRREWQ